MPFYDVYWEEVAMGVLDVAKNTFPCGLEIKPIGRSSGYCHVYYTCIYDKKTDVNHWHQVAPASQHANACSLPLPSVGATLGTLRLLVIKSGS